MSVRMSDVAARAGVSTQTVSRVLRGEKWVAADTAERVRQAATALGYRGNEVAGALKRGHSRTLGLLFPLYTMSIWSEVAEGVEALTHENGYSLLLCDTSDSTEKEEANLSLLLRHRVAGIIYVEPRCRPSTNSACAELVASKLPVVVISADQNDLPYVHVRTDDERAGYVAVRHLLDLGRRLVCVVANGMDVSNGDAEADLVPTVHVQDRIRGAQRALSQEPRSTAAVPYIVVPNTVEGGRRAAESMLRGRSALPDAVFATTDAVALGLLETLTARGVVVPDDIALVSHDGLFASSVSTPALTTITPPMNAMGRESVELLLRVKGGERPSPRNMLDAKLMVRESTIGLGRAARRGFTTPLSDDQAWCRWRSQAKETER